MRENLKKTSITKEVNLHSLRHSYATHLLEQGLNIVTLKELLGHPQITTTMIYLHAVQCPLQQKVLGKIASCRTATPGGHEEVCDNGGTIRYSYNSCGDRHCPKCQAAKQAFWIDDLMQSALPIKPYHIVFTVPHQLNAVCLHNQRLYYDLLFSAVWNTLRSFGYSHYGLESGAVAVLNTWGQNLSLHPHIHCIVPAAGYTLDGMVSITTLPNEILNCSSHRKHPLLIP